MKTDKIEIINKAFLEILSPFAEFICCTLSKKDKNWWKKYVIIKLSEISATKLPNNGTYEECINSLDILACLNIVISNWHDTFKILLKNKRLSYAYELKEIRHNTMGHITIETIKTITEDYVKRALDTMALFMEPIDKEISENIRSIVLDSSVASVIKTGKGKEKKSDNSLSKLKTMQLEFWEYLNEYFHKKNMKLKLSKPKPQHYNHICIGITDISICLTISNNIPSCGMWIIRKNAKEIFSELEKEKDLIENELNGKKLEWDKKSDKKVSRIRIYDSRNINEKKEWDSISEWFKKYSELLYSVFIKRLEKII